MDPLPTSHWGRVAVLVSLFLFTLVTFATVVVVFHFPLEMEVRESTVWLHILASKAGIDPYDGTKVGFANLIYGPLEAPLKRLIHELMPFLESFEVVRFFVALLPLSYVSVAYGWMRGRLLDALLVSVPFYLLLCATDPLAMLVGRPDPTAGFFTNVLLFLTAPWVKEKILAKGKRARMAWMTALALLLTLVFHTIWRSILLPFFFVVGTLLDFKWPRSFRAAISDLLRPMGIIGAVGLFSSVLILLSVFGTDWGEYYRRFYGIYSKASGWGAVPAKEFHWIPIELVRSGQVFWAVCGIALASCFWLNRDRKDELRFWLGGALVLWIVQDVGYLLNGGGGGQRYFFPGVTYLWIAGMHLFPRLEERVPRWREIFCLAVWLGLPWRGNWGVVNHLWSHHHHAAFFHRTLQSLPRGDRFVSDSYHGFKTSWVNDVIDTPDTAIAVAKAGYFGPEFSRVVNEHYEKVMQSPPEFLLLAFIDDKRMADLVRSPAGYKKALEAPPHNLGNGLRYPATLYRKIQPK